MPEWTWYDPLETIQHICRFVMISTYKIQHELRYSGIKSTGDTQQNVFFSGWALVVLETITKPCYGVCVSNICTCLPLCSNPHVSKPILMMSWQTEVLMLSLRLGVIRLLLRRQTSRVSAPWIIGFEKCAVTPRQLWAARSAVTPPDSSVHHLYGQHHLSQPPGRERHLGGLPAHNHLHSLVIIPHSHC